MTVCIGLQLVPGASLAGMMFGDDIIVSAWRTDD